MLLAGLFADLEWIFGRAYFLDYITNFNRHVSYIRSSMHIDMLLTCAGRMGWLQEAHLGAKTLSWKRNIKSVDFHTSYTFCQINIRTVLSKTAGAVPQFEYFC